MPIPCEIVETLVVATSECPATDIIVVQTDTADSSALAPQGLTPPTTVEVANTTTEVVIEAYALMINTAMGDSTASPTAIITELLLDRARAIDTPVAGLDQLAISFAEALDEIAAQDVPQLLISAAQAIDSLTLDSIAIFTATDSARGSSEATPGQLQSIIESASASASVVVIRRAEQLAVEMADGSTQVYPSSLPQTYLLISTGDSASLLMIQQDMVLSLTSVSEAASDVWFRDPNRVAWLMNTETTAASWYDNFDFESITQAPGKVLGVGPDGLYELTGATDDGVRVNASVGSGFTDFGTEYTKRLDAMYFGYTSAGVLSLSTEVKESGTTPVTYFLDQHDATAPRNTRVTPGKGLVGRYWRVTIRNANGADFEIHDAGADIAVSSRRV